MGAVVLTGSTSGSVTLDPPAVAGSTVITLPSTSGTMAKLTDIPAAQWTTTGSDIYYSTGNVGIGMAPTVPLQIKGGTSNGLNETLKLTAGSTSANSGPSIGFNDYYGTNTYPTWKLGEIGAIYAGGVAYEGALVFYTNTGTTATSTSEKMRIASNGQVQINTTGLAGPTGYFEVQGDSASVRNLIATNNTAAGTGSNAFVAFARNGTYTGGISQTGTTSAFVTSSDYRLKDNVAPMTGALDKVALLKPVTYTWKLDGSAGQGFIAHELQEVVPDAVTGEKDAINEDGSIKSQGIDTSFLVATLTAAIQEQQALIENLTTRLSALENK